MQGLPQNRPGAPVGRDIQAAMDRSGADNRRSHLGVTLAIFQYYQSDLILKQKNFCRILAKLVSVKMEQGARIFFKQTFVS